MYPRFPSLVIFKIACTMYSLISRIELETIVAQSSTNITKIRFW